MQRLVTTRPPQKSSMVWFCINLQICREYRLLCLGSVTFWCGPGSPDPYLRPMDPDPDPTPFFIDIKDAKKYFIFFSYNLTCTSTSSSALKKNLWILCVKIIFCRLYSSPLSTFMRKGRIRSRIRIPTLTVSYQNCTDTDFWFCINCPKVVLYLKVGYGQKGVLFL